MRDANETDREGQRIRDLNVIHVRLLWPGDAFRLVKSEPAVSEHA